MSIARRLLNGYRSIQYKVAGRKKNGVLVPGVLCSHEPFEESINHGDVVHPCVRFIEEGFLGHKWWMVYTPYYAANDKTENPILCYSNSKEPEPPVNWHVFCQVQGQPEIGYNSDPTLLYDNESLFVIWRENLTPRCEDAGYIRACFAARVQADGMGQAFGPLVGTNDFEEDPEVSPTFFKSKGGIYKCYAMHLKFHSEFISKLPSLIRKPVSTVASILDLLGFWSQQKSYGIAQWDSNELAVLFNYNRTVQFTNCNFLYRPWHMDFFEWEDKLYAIVQTNQCNADVCLAVSEDGINFRFYKKPLMTNATCGKMGIYKPTGGVIDGFFYLYYTAQNIDNRKLNKMYMTKIEFCKVIKQIQ